VNVRLRRSGCAGKPESAARSAIRPRRQLFDLVDANRALSMLAHDGIDGNGILVVKPS
jgi:hypothetical protein